MESYFADKQAYPAPGYVTDLAVPGAGTDFRDNGQTITLTPTNRVQSWPVNPTTVLPGTYCLSVGSTLDNSGWLWYDSDAGGLLPLSVGCH
jgi:hypothetical protein